ncbi:MAG: NADH:ubiquinone oxidoreductase [Firmicutes bacterium]|jgi:Ni,Fe-hydrogenase III small subunit|uniref:NADH:ubiquinone oxidoreductase n=1 Tax=Sulfobacillus benefaciens TaxID=453960 RepID=A0A2T2X870_9FIRM|nr:NADH:ubiquinone oxidoreductase [Bacillota bacterium]MCL5012572.1 NADH:ubiquinone oxidoreductase [Bacillota bacterium]PSR30701.1 MAG: NADH:ubiquinone oxidoreductase [Sulfobacillus benefaciens]
MFYWRWLSDLIQGPKTTRFPGHPDPDVIIRGENHRVGEEGRDAGPIRRAMAVRHLDAGSCNGCESELQLLSGPDYDFSRFGFSFTPSPRHADIMVVTGVVTESMAEVMQHVFQAMPSPKRVVALGQCAIDGHVFAGAPGVLGSVQNILPVTVEITGCPPTPGDILRGLLEAVEAYPFEQGESANERQVLG